MAPAGGTAASKTKRWRPPLLSAHLKAVGPTPCPDVALANPLKTQALWGIQLGSSFSRETQPISGIWSDTFIEAQLSLQLRQDPLSLVTQNCSILFAPQNSRGCWGCFCSHKTTQPGPRRLERTPIAHLRNVLITVHLSLSPFRECNIYGCTGCCNAVTSCKLPIKSDFKLVESVTSYASQ